jgi:hypothetical protein
MPLMATGDAVLIVCLPADRLGWVFEQPPQMGDHDAIAVCTRGELVGTFRKAWWSYIAGPDTIVPRGRPAESLASAGLAADSTVTEFMQANETATGRTLVGTAP